MAKSTSKSNAKPAAKPAATKKPAAKPAATKKPAAKPAATKKPAAKAAPAKAAPATAKAAPAKPPAPPAPAAPAKTAGQAQPTAAPKPKKLPKPAAGPTVAEIIAASEAIDYRLVARTSTGPTTYSDDTTELVVGPPTLFALEPLAATTRPYLHVIQKDAASGQVVLLHVVDRPGVTRVPAGNGWQRAIVEGTLHLIASDLLLTRPDIVELIGGHEPPTGTARPPFT